MSDLNDSLAQLKEKLRSDMERVLADADALLHSAADSADQTFVAARDRVDERLSSALEQLKHADLLLAEKTSEVTGAAMKEVSLAVRHAVDAGKAAIVAVEGSGQHAAASGIEAARKAATAAVGRLKEAAGKASEAIQGLYRDS